MHNTIDMARLCTFFRPSEKLCNMRYTHMRCTLIRYRPMRHTLGATHVYVLDTRLAARHTHAYVPDTRLAAIHTPRC